MAARAELIEQLRQAEKKYRSIFDNASEGIFQATPDGQLLTANRALARMYGYESPEHLIESLSEIGMQLYLDPEQREAMLEDARRGGLDLESRDRAGAPRRPDALGARKRARGVRRRRRACSISRGPSRISPIAGGASSGGACSRRPAACWRSAGSVAEARPMILKAICELLEWDMGAVWDVDSEAGVLRCVEVWHTPEIDIAEFEQIVARVTPRAGAGARRRDLAAGRAAAGMPICESEHSSPGALIALKNGMGSVFGVPIKVNGEVRHVVEFFSPQVSLPDPELLQLLAVIASQLGLLIERKSAEEALRKSEMRKAAILHSALDCIISFDAGWAHHGVQSGGGAGVWLPAQEALGREIVGADRSAAAPRTASARRGACTS